MNVLRIKLLRPEAKVPTRAHAIDAGLDLRCVHDFWIRPGADPELVRTGVAIELQPGYQATILPKSGLSSDGVHVYTGVVDAGYTGELMVCMQSLLDGERHGSHHFHAGDKIAQMVITKVELPDVVVVPDGEELTAYGTRGQQGWGSSGR